VADEAARPRDHGRGGESLASGTAPARRASLRLRITAAAVLAVALTLGAFTLVFALVQRAVLADAPRAAAAADVSRVVAALEGGATPAQAVAGEAEDAVVVVTDASGTVVAAGGDPDLVDLARTGALRGTTAGGRVDLDGDAFVVEVDGADEPAPTPSNTAPGPSPTPTDDDDLDDDRDDDGDDDRGGDPVARGDLADLADLADPAGLADPADLADRADRGDRGAGGAGADVRLVSETATATASASVTASASASSTAPATASRAGTARASAARDAAGAGARTVAAVDPDGDDWRVAAARSLDEAQAAAAASLVTLGVAVPVAVLVLGATTWVVVGRALRPVDALRREADGIDAARLDRRLADPGGSDEIARLARTLNGMLDRLDASARTQRRFVGDASHELRSPLAVIRQHAEVALLHPDRVDGAALAGTVLGEEARLTALVQGLLVLARADEGALGVQRVPVDLDDLVGAEARRLRAVGAVRVDASGVGPARVTGDAGLLGQVVRNLVDNAARHADGVVALGVVEHPGGGGVPARVELTVDDDGSGVAHEDRERVFERFVRLDDARDRDAGGSGLGLAIVRELVGAHGGRVAVGRSPLGGARFTVTLPAG